MVVPSGSLELFLLLALLIITDPVFSSKGPSASIDEGKPTHKQYFTWVMEFLSWKKIKVFPSLGGKVVKKILIPGKGHLDF